MNLPARTLVVGLGARGKIWTRILHDEPNANVVGYVDLLDSNIEWVQENYGASKDMCFTDLKEALKSVQPEFVLLATPPLSRYGEVLTIFEAGAHLLSEKPLTLDFEEGIRIVRQAHEANLAFSVGVNFRYQHCVVKAREILKSGEIGKPSFSQFTYWINRDGTRPGGNKFPLTMHQPMLYEQSIHHFDEIRYVYDADFERILACQCHNPPWSMYRDDATVAGLFELDNGMLVSYFGTWAGQTKVNEFLWRTDCDDGALFQHEMFSDLRIARGKDATEAVSLNLPDEERLVDDARLMVAHVLQQIAAGEIDPHPSGVDHLKTMALLAACEEASETKQPIIMSEFYDRFDLPQEWR
jgi:predicted dehydrogenase